jgi:hypothetical protein
MSNERFCGKEIAQEFGTLSTQFTTLHTGMQLANTQAIGKFCDRAYGLVAFGGFFLNLTAGGCLAH